MKQPVPEERIRSVMKELAKAAWADPEACAEVLRLVQAYGLELNEDWTESWWSALPEPEKGEKGKRRAAVGTDALAELLADYREAQSKGWTKEGWLHRTADEGFKAAGPYGEVLWNNIETLDRQRKAAQKRSKTDADFRLDVAVARTARRLGKYGAGGWEVAPQKHRRSL